MSGQNITRRHITLKKIIKTDKQTAENGVITKKYNDS